MGAIGRRLFATAAVLTLSWLGVSSIAVASDQIYFPAVDNTTDVLVQLINQETVRVDISTWYLSEHSISIALANKFAAGVPIRLIGDRAAIFEADPHTKDEYYWLANQGVPIRVRYNPWWFPEINHWKAAIFVGQNAALFGSANFAPNELAPFSSTNYCDETVMVTDDSTLVTALEIKFDRIWNDTTFEPQSSAGPPPYLKNWADECAFENTQVPGRCDFLTRYPSPARMTIDTSRLTPEPPGYTFPPDLIWGQGADFNTRLTQEIYNENTAIDIVVYRLTVDNIKQALLDKFRSGVPVRIIVDKDQYSNRAFPEYWLTHANVDTLWAAGIPVVQRMHAGCTHMKTLITTAYATNASSNYTANWQRDHDYFVASATKPTIYTAIKNRFQTMFTDTTGFGPLITTPPDRPNLASPANGASGVSATPTLVWNVTPLAVSYDVYVGTSPSSMTLRGNVPAVMTDSPPSTYSFTPSGTLSTGTYYWQVVAKDNATPVNPSMIGTSDTWSFTTTGGSGGLPSPWVDQDIGPTGAGGNASASSGVFTVNGAGTIWGNSDSFNFVSQPVSGDVTVVARLTSIQNTSTYAKAGIMIRESNAPGAAHVILDVRPTGDLEFMIRPSTGAATTFLGTMSQAPPTWLRLTRSGTTITADGSADGSTWTTIGSTTLSISSNALVGLAVCSVAANTLNTSTFDNVTVSAGSSPPPSTNVVMYASDIPAAALHGEWTTAADSTSPNGIKLVTPNAGVKNTSAALASPAHYVDVAFNAKASTPYTLWLRLQALGNSKYSDSVWVQFSDATSGGAPIYPINSTSGLAVNLATDSTASSDSQWGWVNGAYWQTQAATVSFPTTGTHTMRIQVREDGVEFDQIVLSPSTYLNASASCPNACTGAPGQRSNDATIVAK
jgi:regulation of enolase protein 1 (concanavalin A-like superfamily)